MDDLGRRYLIVALRLGRMDPGQLLSYDGPPELREAVGAGSPTSWQELHDEALRLHEDVAQAGASSTAEQQRAAWLMASTRAVATMARVLGGEEIALPELTEELLDIGAAPAPEPGLAGARRRIDAALDGSGPLADRLARFRREAALPPDAVRAVLQRLEALFARRADEDLGIVAEPLDEAPDDAFTLAELAAGIAARGPAGWGLHRAARRATGGEAVVLLRSSPAWAVGTAVADVGREVLLGDHELEAELGRVARALGLTVDVGRELEVATARQQLLAAGATAAWRLHHDGLPAAEIETYLADEVCFEPSEASATMDVLRHPLHRVEPFGWAHAAPTVREWLATAGQTTGLQRLVTEPLTLGAVRAETEAG